MSGSLTLHRGTLYVGRHGKTARVVAYDLDGHALGEGFRFRDERLGRSEASGLAVDDDRGVWVADTPSQRVRRFSVFGQETGGLGLALERPLEGAADEDRAGTVRQPVDVVVEGDTDGLRLVVASGGERRHGVQVFDEAGCHLGSPRPLGDPRGRFRRIRGLASHGRFLYVAEGGAQRVQVFRDGEFHFAFELEPARQGEPRPEPVALDALEDGRVLVAVAGVRSALLLFDPAGRLQRVVAEDGDGEGRVEQPCDVVVERDVADVRRRVAVLDRDGLRVQVFTLEGRCYGAFEEALP